MLAGSFQPGRFFSYGFRPMFLGTAASGALLIPWWLAVFYGYLPASSPFDPVAWHGHEMLLGFAGSAIGGFLLTAVANWTGRPPVAGWLLGAIAGSWLLGRIVSGVDMGLPPALLLGADALYWILLTAVVGREISAAGNWRNLKVVAILFLFVVITCGFHAGYVGVLDLETTRPALRGATMLITCLIMLIGGRIIPAFTANWLRARAPSLASPSGFGRLDVAVVSLTLPAAVAWTLFPAATTTGFLAVAAGVLHLLRLGRWQGHHTLAEPLLFALHAGYAWLGGGLVLLGLTVLSPGMPFTAGVHAVGAGAMASLILAVASRATLGHSGRALTAGYGLSLAFLLIHAAAVLRVAAAFDLGLLPLSGLLWTLALVIFTVRLMPILTEPIVAPGNA